MSLDIFGRIIVAGRRSYLPLTRAQFLASCIITSPDNGSRSSGANVNLRAGDLCWTDFGYICKILSNQSFIQWRYFSLRLFSFPIFSISIASIVVWIMWFSVWAFCLVDLKCIWYPVMRECMNTAKYFFLVLPIHCFLQSPLYTPVFSRRNLSLGFDRNDDVYLVCRYSASWVLVLFCQWYIIWKLVGQMACFLLSSDISIVNSFRWCMFSDNHNHFISSYISQYTLPVRIHSLKLRN